MERASSKDRKTNTLRDSRVAEADALAEGNNALYDTPFLALRCVPSESIAIRREPRIEEPWKQSALQKSVAETSEADAVEKGNNGLYGMHCINPYCYHLQKRHNAERPHERRIACLSKAAEKDNTTRSIESPAKTLQPFAPVQYTICPVLTIPGVFPRSCRVALPTRLDANKPEAILVGCVRNVNEQNTILPVITSMELIARKTGIGSSTMQPPSIDKA
ncbi:hypothetical protein T10_12707 [Trichinella papuae]|uniref:Uncharacterized protein n=1 Tax=Trichinella papuae TaxID=268474 RepID=A0A0V1MEI1_9BILA|nr:hypothetical protein T10_12707 [Trichinella papuae]